MHPHPGLREGRDKAGGQIGRAVTVNRHVYLHAAAGRLQQRRVQRQTNLVLKHDEGFEHDFVPGRGNAFEHTRKKILAVFKQPETVAADPPGHGSPP